MEGSADEIGAPDSWEMADLDETMSGMLLHPSSKKGSSSVPSNPESYDESAPASDAMGLGGGDRRGGFAEDALSQVDQFLREALDKPRERLSILRMEQDVEKFLRDRTQHQLEFQSLPTSYLRLAAHRIAQHYYLQSLVLPGNNSLPDGSGSRIVLIKTPESRFPAVRLADIPVSQPQEDVNTVKVAIKQRPQKGSQNGSDPNARSSRTGHPKTVEERKEEYNRARARIFSNSGGTVTKPESDSAFVDSFQVCPITTSRSEETVFDGHESTMGRGSSGSSGSSRTNKNKTEKELVVSRYRPSNRVAIFRDREVERKDPDYDRNYDRYTQRFDPGLGGGGPYTIQPLFLPSVNYSTEIPQLGSGHRPQISIEHLPQPIPQHIRGPWSATSTPGAIGYGPPEAMIPTLNVNRIGSHPTSSMYMHSSQYPVPFRPGMSFVLPHESVQPFPQTHQQQSEASFGLARPR